MAFGGSPPDCRMGWVRILLERKKKATATVTFFSWCEYFYRTFKKTVFS